MNTFKMIAAAMLRVPPDQYQRDQKDPKVKKMAANYNEEALSALDVVGPDVNGMYDILDGAHRWMATVIARGEHFTLPCMVHAPVDVAHQAGVYVTLNGDRTPLKAMELHKANLIAGESTAVEVEKIAAESGFPLIAGGSNGAGLQCITTLRDIYQNLGGDVLESSLGVCREAWGTEVSPVSNVIAGIARVIGRHYERVEIDRLASVVSTRSYQQWQILAREDRLVNGRQGLVVPIANKLIHSYNKGVRGGARLAEIKRGPVAK